MDHIASPNPPAIPSARPQPTRRARWTPALQARFLGVLLQSGCVRHAARAVGLSPSSAHRLRRRLAGAPFDRDWDEALRLYAGCRNDPLAFDHALGIAGPGGRTTEA